MRHITATIIVFFLINALCACQPITPRFGKEYNLQRNESGMPPIPDDWQSAALTTKYTTWRNPKFEELYNKHLPFHASKYVDYKNGELAYETDEYIGAIEFIFDQSLLREKIHITYYYSNHNPKYEWAVDYDSSKGMSKSITLDEAKEILNSWNLSYP